ncbi:DUF2931 family protein [Salmonella bongori CFSAN000509]|uniref:DUF2931 family protein n=1 Tax=Salmonella enterica TaxID=28901 RepID=A0A750P5N5_SALER|nr:DUF2931 family protein [Salmonella bongori serovar 48:i:-]EDP8575653.1 DUF2931 family protein [Salmonella bongori]EGS1128454.1 DUF2931 family protein [Salmonella bongori CFSAN000509]EDP8591801.1 DUF2931 family protein [Salmonella bongori]EDP8595922.1 DUF2931 family protein [Salmonella bongori]
MPFCWDSVIDKKAYETRITFSVTVWKMTINLIFRLPVSE